MLSNRPYLLRAFYQWIVDSGCTPILVLDATNPRCKVPKDYIEGGEIVFNISPSAIRDLKMLNDLVEFKASFSGVIHMISAPIKAVMSVYAEENGEGIFFDAEDGSDDADELPPVQLKSIEGGGFDGELASAPVEGGAKAKPSLRLVE